MFYNQIMENLVTVKSKFLMNLFDQNTYVLKSKKEAIIIDAGAELEDVLKEVENKKVLAVLMTHLHFDHIWNIEQYLEKYKGISNFMENIVKETKEKGYVETLFKRKRVVEELKSKNFNIKSFGERVAMNTPIQGTAADIMKIAMINVYKRLKNENLKSKLILQVHDEIMIEAPEEEKIKVKQIIKEEMENVVKLNVELQVEVQEGKDWYNAK